MVYLAPLEVDPLYPTQKGWAIAATAAVFLVALWITYQGQPQKNRRLLGVLLGKDGRLSTSKSVAAAWTVVISYIFIALILLLPDDWVKPLKFFDATYLLLLGSPYAALVAAKGIVSARVANGTLSKPPAATPKFGDLVSDDSGQPDLFDVQYVVFNFIAIILVLSAFAHAKLDGFPAIPSALIVLTGGPAAVYAANKFFGGDTPTILSIEPPSVPVGSTFTINGQNLVGADGTRSTVSVGSMKADVIVCTPVKIVAVAPAVGTNMGLRSAISVTTSAGAQASFDEGLEVSALTPTLYGSSRGTARVGETIELSGDWGDVPREELAAVFDGSVLARVTASRAGKLVVVVPDVGDTTPSRRVPLCVRNRQQASNSLTIDILPTDDSATPAAAPAVSGRDASYFLTR